MTEDPWKEKEKVLATPITGNTVKNYIEKKINKIATNIDFDEEDFIPIYEKNCAKLLANTYKKSICLSPGAIASIDCGFSIKLLEGYKACVAATLCGAAILTNNEVEDRVKVNILNISDKDIFINHKDVIAKIWLEPVYFFDWRNNDTGEIFP